MNSKLCKEPCPKKGRNDYDSARPDTVEPRILMVDDNSMMRETARDILRWKIPNLSFDEAGNAAEALDLIHQHLPDLILMDISLPGDSGLELTRKIKSLYPQIVIVIFTNCDHSEYREAAIKNGAEFFLSKSVHGKYKLIEVVEFALRGTGRP